VTLQEVLARIPYLRLHHLEVDTRGAAVRVQLPLIEAVTNHVGIVHAGALYTTAETAAGVAAWGVVPGDAAYVLLRDAEVRYRRRAETAVIAEATIDEADAEQARAEFARTARGDVSCTVTATDTDGTTVFEGTFRYALRPRS